VEAGASKGAFYHYFGSKQELLEAIVDRMIDRALVRVQTVVDDDTLAAIDKFRGYFRMIAAIKAEQREFVLQLLKTWYSDDNAIVREKLRREQINRVAPHMTAIIRQGVSEGSFALSDPERMARVVLALILDAGDDAGDLLLRRQGGDVDFETVRRHFDTYQLALERLLGVTPGELELVDNQMLELWFSPDKETR